MYFRTLLLNNPRRKSIDTHFRKLCPQLHQSRHIPNLLLTREIQSLIHFFPCYHSLDARGNEGFESVMAVATVRGLSIIVVSNVGASGYLVTLPEIVPSRA